MTRVDHHSIQNLICITKSNVGLKVLTTSYEQLCYVSLVMSSYAEHESIYFVGVHGPGSIPAWVICELSLFHELFSLMPRGFFAGLSGFPPSAKINTHGTSTFMVA